MILIAIRALHSHATVNWARKIDAAIKKLKYCIGFAVMRARSQRVPQHDCRKVDIA